MNLCLRTRQCGDWPEAARWVEQLRALASDIARWPRSKAATSNFQWKGDTRLLSRCWMRFQPVSTQMAECHLQPDGTWPCCRPRLFAPPNEILEASSANETSYSMAGLTPKIFLEGCTYVAQGDNRECSEGVRTGADQLLKTAVKEAPESAERHASLGLALRVVWGGRTDAIGEGRRAVELKPESKDAVDGVTYEWLSRAHLRSGR